MRLLAIIVSIEGAAEAGDAFDLARSAVLTDDCEEIDTQNPGSTWAAIGAFWFGTDRTLDELDEVVARA